MLLVVGDSEASLFESHANYLINEFGIPVVVNSRSGRSLSSCIVPINNHMTREVKAVFLIGLTCMAWKLEKLLPDQEQPKVVVPNTQLDLSTIPGIMEEITTLVHSKNRFCVVYLIIPTIKDMYCYNQHRLEKSLGSGSRDLLQTSARLNPTVMRNHAVKVYDAFRTLITGDYSWTQKHFLVSNHAINRWWFGQPRGQTDAPHKQYLSKRTGKLNVEIIPDGLHGNLLFLKNFMRSHVTIIFQNWRASTRAVTEVLRVGNIQESNQQVTQVLENTSPELVEVASSEPVVELIHNVESINNNTQTDIIITVDQSTQINTDDNGVDDAIMMVNNNVIIEGVSDLLNNLKFHEQSNAHQKRIINNIVQLLEKDNLENVLKKKLN